MSYSNSDPSSCCSASAELKLYQAFIFSIPIFFTFILLLLFYLFYLRRRRVDWASLRMRSSMHDDANHTSGVSELGLKKEVREMLPIIVFKESFSVSVTQLLFLIVSREYNKHFLFGKHLRIVVLKIGVVGALLGSAFVEFGNTKVIFCMSRKHIAVLLRDNIAAT